MTGQPKLSLKPTHHILTCPCCNLDVEIPDAEFIDGAEVLCLHCFEDSILSRELIPHSNREQWLLVEPAYDHER